MRISFSLQREPAWHYTATAENGYSYTYGGRIVGFDANKDELSSHVEVFDHYLERWTRKDAGGSPPHSLYGGRGCSQSDTSEISVFLSVEDTTDIHGVVNFTCCLLDL